MSSRRATLHVLVVWVALCAAARVVSAQGLHDDELPTGDVTAALSLQAPRDVNVKPYCLELSLPCGSPRTFGDLGWVLSGGRQVNDGLGIVVEVGMYDNHWESVRGPEQNIVRYLATGVRLGTPFMRLGRRERSRSRFFGQVLIGAIGSDNVRGGLLIQPGGGMDVRTARGVVLRVELDYALAPAGIRNLSTGRALFGVVIGVGSREP